MTTLRLLYPHFFLILSLYKGKLLSSISIYNFVLSSFLISASSYCDNVPSDLTFYSAKVNGPVKWKVTSFDFSILKMQDESMLSPDF